MTDPPSDPPSDPLDALANADTQTGAAQRRRALMRNALFPEVSLPPQIGRFAVRSVLGAGAMGTVYACHDEQLDRTVAVKVLRATRGPQASARLLREARALARVSHPHIVTIFEVGPTEDGLFIAMEYLTGGTLRTWQQDRSGAEILQAYRDAGAGLAAVHAAGLVHRDFKPANVLMGDDGTAQVADFGLVRAVGDLHAEPSDASLPRLSELTATGAVLGTPAYMAPEQLLGQAAGPWADQFAFCTALYEALVGERPFSATTGAKALAQMGKGAGRRTLSRRVYAALSRGLAIDPTERWPDMPSLLDALAPSPRRWPWVLGTAGAVAALAALALVWLNPTSLGPTDAPLDTGVEHARQLMADDPTAAALVLAQTDPAEPGWTALAWAALHQPLVRSEWRSPIHGAAKFSWAHDGVTLLTSRFEALWRRQGATWVQWPLVPGFAMQFGLSPPSDALQMQTDIATRSRSRMIPGDPPHFVDGGWLFRWTPQMPQAVTPFPYTQILSGGRDRLVAKVPGEVVHIVPLDGSAARALPGTEDATFVRSNAHADAIVLADGEILLVPVDGPVRVVDRSANAPQRLVFSPDGQWLALISASPRIIRLDGRAAVFKPAGDWQVRVEFSADSRRALMQRVDGTLVEWSLSTRRARTARSAIALQTDFVADADDGWFAAGSDNRIRHWRMHDSTRIATLPKGLWSAFLDASGTYVTAAGRDGRWLRVRADGAGQPQQFQHPGMTPERSSPAYRAITSPDGTEVLSGAADGAARVWRLGESAPIATFAGHSTWAYALAASPDGRHWATADKLGTVRLWPTDGAEASVRTWPSDDPRETQRIHHLAFADDGRALVWGHRDGAAYYAPLSGPKRLLRADTSLVRVASNGMIAATGRAPNVDLFDAQGTRIRTLSMPQPAITVVFDEEAAQIAVSSTDRHLYVFDVKGQRERRFGPLEGAPEFFAFSPDGQSLAYGLGDGAIEIIDLATGDRWPVGAMNSGVRSVLWPKPGTHLVVGETHGALRRWPVDRRRDALLTRLRAASSVCLSAAQRERWLGEDARAALAAFEACQTSAKSTSAR